MTFRPATVDDVPAILPLVGKICALHQAWDADRFAFKPNVVEMYRGWLSQRATDPRSVLIVADQEGVVVGYIVGTIESEIPIYWTPECGWIHDLWVEETYRNEGVARQLVMLAVERFKSIGVTQIRLQTATANTIARELFVKCGFRDSTVEMLMTV